MAGATPSFTLNLVTPEKKLVTDLEIDEVLVPGFMGQLDILPGHAPLMTTLATGVLKYRARGAAEFQLVVVSWGYAQVHPGGVVILADLAEAREELDRVRVEESLREANEKLLDPLLDVDQMEVFRHKLDRAQARLEALGGETSVH